MVGEKLTAVEGTLTPQQDSFAYKWFADGEPIDGATGKTLVLAKAQLGAKISVEVTGQRAGYVDVSDTSDESAAVVTDKAPSLTLSPSVAKLRLGRSTELSWSSDNAVTLEASGSWTGSKTLSGSETVTPTTTGTSTYILRAKNTAGTTTAQVAVPVSLPPKALLVTGNSSPRADRGFTIRASGLEGGEKFTMRLGGRIVATGNAASSGRISRVLHVPSSLKAGRHTMQVTGSMSDRTGSRTIEVVRTEAIALAFKHAKVRVSQRQQVIVSKLMPGEKVTVVYGGRTISKASAKANAKGVFSMTFKVGDERGKKAVRATAASTRLSVKKTFTVIR